VAYTALTAVVDRAIRSMATSGASRFPWGSSLRLDFTAGDRSVRDHRCIFLATADTTMIGSGSTSNQTRSGQSRAQGLDPNAYLVDSLVRADANKPDITNVATPAEAATIFAHALAQGEMSAADKPYLDQLVSARTGLPQTEADKPVSDVFSNAQQNVEAARKATAPTPLWIFLALGIGASCASFSATIGGRQRDNVVST
jgi:hypothetical protein